MLPGHSPIIGKPMLLGITEEPISLELIGVQLGLQLLQSPGRGPRRNAEATRSKIRPIIRNPDECILGPPFMEVGVLRVLSVGPVGSIKSIPISGVVPHLAKVKTCPKEVHCEWEIKES